VLEWQWPWLALLVPLPWLLRRTLPPLDVHPAAVRVPFHAALTHPPVISATLSRPSAVLATLAWLLLLAAAARPVWLGEPVPIERSGRDLMLAVDISDSMRIDDMRVGATSATRIEAVKTVLGDFIERRRGDRLGLILFGQRSYLQTPLTFDRDSVAIQLEEALPGFAGSSTAIGDAIGLAIATLRDRPAESRVLVLLTDGSNTAGTAPEEATEIAAEAGIRIHTVGVGSRERRTVLDPAGGEHEIDPSRDLDEGTLQRIATASGGRYFRATDPSSMAGIYAAIDTLEPVPEERLARPRRSLYHWPLALALLSALLPILHRRH